MPLCAPPTSRTGMGHRRSLEKSWAHPWLRHVFADGGYAGNKLRYAPRRIGKWTVEIIKRSDIAKRFELLPCRWVVERTLAWLSRNRRLAKNSEETIASATAWLFIASIQLYAHRVVRP